MISSPNRSRRSGAPVRLVVIHTAEGARTTTALGNYFARASVQASSHAGIDDHGIETYVPYSEASWTLRSGNSISDNVELCGFAAWARGQWLNEHRLMLEHTARWIRERCTARGIPIRKLTPSQVAAGQAGVIGHHDWTVGMRDGTHTDPGPGFPWDVVITLAARLSPTPRPEDPFMALTDADQALLVEAARSVLFGRAGVRGAGDMALAVATIGNDVTALRSEVAALLAKPAAQVDTAAVVKGVVDAITAQGLGPLVADELARRLTQ